MGGRVEQGYEWRDRPASATATQSPTGHLSEWMFDDSEQTYGHRRIHAALHRQGERISRSWSARHA